MPPIDAILVSHNHYDHLDLRTLSRFARHGAPRILTPLGNDAIIRRHDPRLPAEAYDWGARIEIAAGVAVHNEPCYHWSARWLNDRRKALWCAFAIETPAGRIYHVADTAWGDGALFAAARKKHGDFRLAILPIGSYEPRWFMREHHVDPHESVRIFETCGARQALAHHWGTFQLTDEAIDAPVKALGKALDARGIPRERFAVRRPGETLELEF
jgi:L-ascorbate metabolism protein UlaG (beta-lactamase superfamily)